MTNLVFPNFLFRWQLVTRFLAFVFSQQDSPPIISTVLVPHSTISLLTEGPHMRGCLTVIWRSPKAWQVGSSPPITCWTVAWFPLLWHFSCFKLQFLSGWENNISRPAAYYCPFAASSLWSGEVLPSSVAHCPECFPIWTGFPSRQVPTEFLPLYPRGTERTRFCRSALLTSHSHHSTAAYFPSRLFRDA